MTAGPELLDAFGPLAESDRRALLKAMGASLAMAAAAGCRGPPEEARPYVMEPPDTVLGAPRAYATAMVFAGYAQPVLAKSYEGRPIKLEGLPEHPASLGAADAFTQAALLGLYDPNRSKSPRRNGRRASWAAFDAWAATASADLDRTGGAGLRLLTSPVGSPTLQRQIEALLRRWPAARWHVHEPVDRDRALEAARLAWGRPLELQPRFDRCAAVVSFDDDFLGPGPQQTRNARAWARRRRGFQKGDESCALMVAEPAPTLTGAMAQDRLAVAPAHVATMVQSLAGAMGLAPTSPALTARQDAWLSAATALLTRHRGRALVTVGAGVAPEVQCLAQQINARIGALNETLAACAPIRSIPTGATNSLAALCEDLTAGRVDTLVIVDANPAYTAPADLGFAAAIERARVRVHMGLHFDETAARSHWHVPVEHELETWSDARAVDGRPSLIQPLVRPFLSVRSRHLLLENLQGRFGGDARHLMAETWRDRLGAPDDPRWAEALQAGFLDDPADLVRLGPPARAPIPAIAPAARLTLLVRPDPTIWDGSGANNPWLQELPKPFTKLTWDNAIWASPALASRLKLRSGDMVRVAAGARMIEGPVCIVPGLDRTTLVAHLGYGRRLPRQLADRLGYDAYPMRTMAAPDRIEGVEVSKTGRRMTLATTQPNAALGDFDLVRTAPLQDVAPGPGSPPPPSFYPGHRGGPPQWGMAIDSDLCIACNACITACDAENNVPMVGKAQVAKGREMHWLRVDQYFKGPPDDPVLLSQPVPCMHCEQAPCEMGCPVNAAVHSTDGLNLQVYNRCIGTRTCSSFCPYKVRRFNWFDFTGGDSPELRAARNPEVTVRDRGVMEKCTYCVQRIEKARIAAKAENRPLRDGDVRTACQQTCPTDAIVFGDVSDPSSAVSRLKAQRRNYALLAEVNTRPRTTYLARIRGGSPDD